MNATHEIDWIEGNRAALSTELAWLRRLLERDTAEEGGEVIEAPASTPTLNFLTRQFQLSVFERTVLLLCAGLELESDWSRLCAAAQGSPNRDYPTFSLALSLLPEAHWSALSPHAPLRYWEMLQVSDTTRLSSSRLSLDEHILHFLLGTGALDRRLVPLVSPFSSVAPISLSQEVMSRRIQRWMAESDTPLISLCGNDPEGARVIAAQALTAQGAHPFLVRAEDIPAAAEERERLARLLTREWLLGRAVVLLELGEGTQGHLASFLDQLSAPVILLGLSSVLTQRPCFTLEIQKPTTEEQQALWQSEMVGMDVASADVARLSAHFDLSSVDIAASARQAKMEAEDGGLIVQSLWQACQRRTRGGMERLAHRIAPRATWEDLVLPPGPMTILKDIARQVRHRTTVYEKWGFGAKGARGLGISALFAGESGTGKTLSAEVIAGDLGLDLYRIDLSAVVSKYIGETEKNLERLFTEAEACGAVLLFDEADALFGKRSDVKDSHDRYANIELAYLLQRMETYRGLSILTTNLKSMLDTAFLRRIRFVVQFPFPDMAQRAEIWRRIFPRPLPRQELRFEQLARLTVTGGNIRNIAMNAAFFAAEEGGSLGMAHLARAARMEYSKLEKTMNEAEMGGWQ